MKIRCSYDLLGQDQMSNRCYFLNLYSKQSNEITMSFRYLRKRDFLLYFKKYRTILHLRVQHKIMTKKPFGINAKGDS